MKEQRAKSKEQRAKSKEQRAKSKEQRAKSKEQPVVCPFNNKLINHSFFGDCLIPLSGSTKSIE
jgi:hypothetical protein